MMSPKDRHTVQAKHTYITKSENMSYTIYALYFLDLYKHTTTHFSNVHKYATVMTTRNKCLSGGRLNLCTRQFTVWKHWYMEVDLV